MPYSSEKQKAYYAANRGRLLEKARRERSVEGYSARRKTVNARYRAENREKIKGYNLAKYGITLREYEYLAGVQDNMCRICGAKAQKERYGKLHVDHDHSTGEIGGLLCVRCNTGLGSFQDSRTHLEAAIHYLTQGHRAMSSFTFADLKLGGRLTAACDAIGANHLLRAAGLFNEVADDLNSEATAATMDDEAPEEDWSVPMAPVKPPPVASPQDLQMCSRGVHSYSEPDPTTGWRVCASCGLTNVAPPGGGPVDIGGRQ